MGLLQLVPMAVLLAGRQALLHASRQALQVTPLFSCNVLIFHQVEPVVLLSNVGTSMGL